MKQNAYAFSSVDMIRKELPTFSESFDRKFIKYGDLNEYPQFINTLFQKSAINKTCIMAKADGVFGGGLVTGDESKNYLLNRANTNGSWNDLFERIVLDYVIFSGFAINVIWSNDGETITDLYHLDFTKVRSGTMNFDTEQPDEYLFSHDWTSIRKFPSKSYPRYDPTKALEQPSQILYFFDYSPGASYYPIPSYSGALSDIQLDIEVSNFHLNNINNGMAPSLWISLLNGVPDPATREEIHDEINASFRGSNNAGKAFISFADDAEHAPQVVPIEAANSDFYVILEQRITSRILSAHRISSPLLLGLYQDGAGWSSNADEIETSYQHFLSTVIKPMQKPILKVLNELFDYNTGTSDIDLQIEPNRLIEAQIVTEEVE